MSPGVALRLIAAVALLTLVWWQVDPAEAMGRLSRPDPVWVLVALACLLAQTVLTAWRWRLAAGALGVRLTPRRALSEYFLAQLVNQILPGGVVGDMGRAVRSSGAAGLRRAGGAVLFERMLGQAAMLGLLLAGLSMAALHPGAVALSPVLLVPALLVAAVLGGGVITLATSRRLKPARAALTTPRILWPQAGLSLLAAVLNLAAFDACARATGTALPLAAIPLLLPLILFTMIVPVTIAGWGLREGAAAALFPMAGATAAGGLAAGTAFGLAFLVSTLAGAGFFAFHDRKMHPPPEPTDPEIHR